MDTLETNLIETLLGAIILGLGLVYLAAQYQGTEKLSSIALEIELGNENLYQQYHKNSIRQISMEELYSVLIGFREYPISIDGTLIAPDDMDYTKYISLIKEGYYTKSYLYNDTRDIIMILYTYAGTGVS